MQYERVHTILPRGRNLRHVEVASAYEVIRIHFVPVQENMIWQWNVDAKQLNCTCLLAAAHATVNFSTLAKKGNRLLNHTYNKCERLCL